LNKEELLESVASEIRACTKCSLWKARRNAVPGEGNAKARVMFVGEAPGFSEDLQGRPFVGDAGKFLETLLSDAGFSRTDVFICNVLKCRPPKNREPQIVEIEACTPYLDRQIEIIKPKVIVTLGNHSTAYVFSKVNITFSGITAVHGKFFNAKLLGLSVLLFPTFHPAAALYNPRYKELLVGDFELLKKELVRLNLR